MTEHQADLPDKYTLGDSWGIGWIRFGWDGQPADRPRRQHDRPGRVPAAAAGRGAGGHAADQRRQHPRPLRGPLPRDLRRARRRRDAAPARPRRREPVAVDARPARSAPTSGPACGIEVLGAADGPGAAHDGHRPARRADARADPRVPDGRRSAENLFVVREPDTQTWTPVTFYELPTGERYLHFGVRATPEGGLTWTSLEQMLADIGALVAVESPSADLAAVARVRRGGGRHRVAALGVAPSGSSSTAGRTCAGGSADAADRRVLLLGHHDTVWPLGSLATPPVRGRRRGAARAGLLRHEGRAGHRAARRWPACRPAPPVTVLSTGDEEIGSPSLARAHRGRGGRRARPRSCSRRRPTAARSRPSARASRSTGYGRSAARPTPASSRRGASTRPSSWPTRCWPSTALGRRRAAAPRSPRRC